MEFVYVQADYLLATSGCTPRSCNARGASPAREGGVDNLVEKKAPSASWNRPSFRWCAPVNAPFIGEIRLDQGSRNRTTVHGDKRFLPRVLS